MMRLPIRFNEEKRIQLADYVSVCQMDWHDYIYDNKFWGTLATKDGSYYHYNSETNTKISKEEMEDLLAKGEAEVYDYHNVRHLKMLQDHTK